MGPSRQGAMKGRTTNCGGKESEWKKLDELRWGGKFIKTEERGVWGLSLFELSSKEKLAKYS